jgi:asparagine synthase (glutamine-hydrolysing)
VWHLDEPFADSSALLTFLISREAKKFVTVALTGIGGDEMFAGYPRYLGARASLFYEHLPYFIRSAMAYLTGLFPEPMTSTNTIGRLKRFTQGSLKSHESRYLLWLSYVNYELKQRLYSKDLKDALGSFWPHISYEEILRKLPGDYPDKVNALDVQTYLPDDLLYMADKMSMANGLELRVPFCDRKVVEFALSISVGRRTSGLRLKSLFKGSLREVLPRELLKKRKQGFMMPIGAWLRSELQPLCRDLLSPERVKKRGFFDPGAVSSLIDSHCSGRENAAHQIYAILVLELWCQHYLD